MQFYPESPTVTVDPVQGNGELRYILEFPPDFFYTSRQDFTLKYAFHSKWEIDSALKSQIRNILVKILDVEHFQVEIGANNLSISVPLKPLTELSLLPRIGVIEIPVVVKLTKKSTEDFQMKCIHKVCLISNSSGENGLKLPAAPRAEEHIEGPRLATAQNTPTMEAERLSIPKEKAIEKTIVGGPLPLAEEEKRRIYSGLMAIDFGTTNSVVVVRDPHYGADEIQDDLSEEQWRSLLRWLDSWIIYHLSALTPTESDTIVAELIDDTPNMDLSPLGSLSIDLWEDLQKISAEDKAQLLKEVLAFLSLDLHHVASAVQKKLAYEVLGSFERVIYSKTLESQRYFVLELDQNAGPGPISSTLQIVSAPSSSDREKLEGETEVEMGIRVNLLMRSATMREADIRQFALNIKRYFGQNESIELVPAETASVPITFSDATLCRLTYKKLIERAIEDIRRRSASQGMEYADWVRGVVATFPTTYPPSLRRKLRDMLNEMDISEIDTRFDEGTASAIYYIWREICADPVCGMDGLMARCRQDRYQRAYQNILLYDFGGGTTDVALIQLIYEELPIFEPIDKEKFKNGRYFRITPRLLGSTGHRYIGGDLITLGLFRLVKTKLVDRLLSLLAERQIEPPVGSGLDSVWSNLPEGLATPSGRYRPGILLDWTYQPADNLKLYEEWNRAVIDRIIPTAFAGNHSYTPNFFTLWDLTEEAKKDLGSPVATYMGSGLGREWKKKVDLDHNQLWKLVTTIHPWVESSGLTPEDFSIGISQKEVADFASEPVVESLSIAVNMVKARLSTSDVTDKLDRFILSGFSCNLQVVQEEAKKIFGKNEKLFEFSLASVSFEQEVAKTSVAMGACIGRYLESVRLNPYDERTREMLRDGYDQVELVVENLFNYLTCRLAYGSLVAMVTMFDYGLPFNQRSYYDGRPVTRTPMDELRPVQEKFWIYRIDYEGAVPQYLGLINAEATCYNNNLEDFRKFREEYVVGFEADSELFIRAFFLPRGPKNLLAIHFLEDKEHPAIKNYIGLSEDGFPILMQPITSQELFNRKPVLLAGAKMENTVEYPDGRRYRCILSPSQPIREMYDFYIEDESAARKSLVAHFYLAQEEVEETALLCDETGRLVLLLSVIYDIKIWADIEYVPQKLDPQYDPFCGQH